MKYNFLFIFFLLLNSCTQTQSKYYKKNEQFFSSKGFALIYSDLDFQKKNISKKLDNEKLQIAHRTLSTNKLLVLTNPENNKSIALKVTKKTKYPQFFNIVITEKVSQKLGLNPDFPFIEIHERSKNKSFIAKKAEMFKEEKSVSDKAPVTKIKIDNISKNEIKIDTKKTYNRFYILIGEFYKKNAANNLKNILIEQNIEKDLLKINNLGKNRFQLTSGPYFKINTLKNDYFKLNMYGFDDLDIIKK